MSLWIIIPGCIGAYLAAGIVVLVVMTIVGGETDGSESQIAVFWPLVITVGIGIGFHRLTVFIARKANRPELRERMRKRVEARAYRAEQRAARALHSDLD